MLQQSAHVASAMCSAGKNYLGRTSPKINHLRCTNKRGTLGFWADGHAQLVPRTTIQAGGAATKQPVLTEAEVSTS